MRSPSLTRTILLARRHAAWAAIVLLASCGGDGLDDRSCGAAPQGTCVSMAFDPSGDADIYGLGFPSDVYQDAEGRLDLTRFPRLAHALTERLVRVAAEDSRGFAPAGAIAVRLTGPVEAIALSPDPATYASPGSPVQVIDVDPRSPERGRRFPLEVRITPAADVYRPAGLLEALPSLGIGLRPATRYALLVTDDLPVPPGVRVGVDPALAAMLRGRDPGGALGARAVAAFAPLADQLRDEGLDPRRVVAATVFTTGSPTARLTAIAARLGAWPAPTPDAPLARIADFPDYCVLGSTWPAPGFQDGTVPFLTESQGGVFQLDPSGEPSPRYVNHTSFVVTIPKRAMPPAGFPIVQYLHGTGNLASEVYLRGRDPGTGVPEPGGGPAAIVARRGWAAASMSGHLSSEHFDGPLSLDGHIAYDFFNPRAMRDNYTQLVAEQVLFRKLVEALRIDPALCAGADAGAAPDGLIRVDPGFRAVMGHSQGSVVGGMLAAVDPAPPRALILDGAGASWIESVFGVTDPLDLERLVEVLALGLPAGQTLDVWHPVLLLAEMAMGAADNLFFLPELLRDPPDGREPPHVLVFEGHVDHQVPVNMQRALVGALGVDLGGEDVGATPSEQVLPRVLLGGRRQVPFPTRGNVAVPGAGPRTGGVVRYPEDGILDGHHVVFQRDEPKHVYGCFLADLAAGRVPAILDGTSADAPCSP